ncbi:cya [Acrasis kona]|uniref:Cya n=1 Tax=Acrasis kona TaxID=1008807 RepID=A0AAW2Z4E7_9EUKA
MCTSIINRVLRTKRSVIVDHANAQNDYQSVPYIKKNAIKSIMCCPIMITQEEKSHVMGVVYLENNKVQGIFTEHRNVILKTIIDSSIENAQIFTSLNSAYARFLPRKFLSLLGKTSVTNVSAGDAVERTMSVLFSDIRNFTSITESMSASNSFLFVNQFLNHIAPQIDRNDGFIDKFIGDAVMAIFAGTVTSALQSAIGMISALKEFNKDRDHSMVANSKEDMFMGKVSIGVGIHYGKLMIGTIGYKARLDATVISDTVNIANRLEGLTKILGVEIIISQSVIEQYERESCEGEVLLASPTEASPLYANNYVNFIKSRRLGVFVLKGMDPLVLYQIYDDAWYGSDYDLRVFEEKNDKFKQAVEGFNDKNNMKRNREVFKNLANEYPNDKLIALYATACDIYSNSHLPDSWQGEIRIDKDGNVAPFGGLIVKNNDYNRRRSRFSSSNLEDFTFDDKLFQ